MTYVVRIPLSEEALVREYEHRVPAMREYHHGRAESVHALDGQEVGA